jgi:hypothetical protein
MRRALEAALMPTDLKITHLAPHQRLDFSNAISAWASNFARGRRRAQQIADTRLMSILRKLLIRIERGQDAAVGKRNRGGKFEGPGHRKLRILDKGLPGTPRRNTPKTPPLCEGEDEEL